MSYKTIAHIDMTLDPRSIRDAIKQVKHIRDSLQKALSDLAKELTAQGAEIAKMQVASMEAVDTGQLENSIYGIYDAENHVGYIRAGEGLNNGEGISYAFYVEYGTGPVGEASPHPQAGEIGWEYDVGPTIHEDPDHPERGRFWYYPGNDGKIHWTCGQPARPFMFNTMEWLEEAAAELGRQILS